VPSPAGEGWDEGKLKSCFPQFISPHPNLSLWRGFKSTTLGIRGEDKLPYFAFYTLIVQVIIVPEGLHSLFPSSLSSLWRWR